MYTLSNDFQKNVELLIFTKRLLTYVGVLENAIIRALPHVAEDPMVAVWIREAIKEAIETEDTFKKLQELGVFNNFYYTLLQYSSGVHYDTDHVRTLQTILAVASFEEKLNWGIDPTSI